MMPEPKLDRMEHAQLDPDPEKPGSVETGGAIPNSDAPPVGGVEPVGGLAPVTGRDGKFVIRDPKGSLRVDGLLKGGRMDGKWQFFDPTGRRLAEVHYRADQRHGPATLYYVAADGKGAAGRKRLTAEYQDGTLHGFARNWYPNGDRQLEREFDQGILQASRGWGPDGKDLADGAAQTAGLETSRTEDALLTELEAFVQLKIRQNAGTAS